MRQPSHMFPYYFADPTYMLINAFCFTEIFMLINAF